MTVYLVKSIHKEAENDDMDYVEGIFSTRAKAYHFIKSETKYLESENNNCFDYWIEEYTVI